MSVNRVTRIICGFLALVAVTVLMSAEVRPARAEISAQRILKVGLNYGSSAKSAATVTSEQGFRVGHFEDRTFAEDGTLGNQTLSVNRDGDSLVLRDTEGNTLYTEQGGKGIGLCPIFDDFWDERFTFEGVGYRGSLSLVRDGNGFAAINVVDIDQYLYGVVSREMSESWPIEALKAQAICSRNYALRSIGKHSGYGFDLCANTHCQMYTGTSREAESVYNAVDATRGMVLAYNGELCECYYSSSMGSVTEDVKYVWGNEVPYLVSVDNSFEDTQNIPNGVWSGTLTVAEASTIMRNRGYEVGDVQKIEAIEYSPEGRVTKLRVTGNTAVKTLEREECRTIFGSVTKSQMFTVTGDGEAASSTTVAVTDGEKLLRRRPKQIEILSDMGRNQISGDTIYTTNGVYQKTYIEGNADESAPNTSFTFTGTGWGHGVGMSQYGAKGMADRGYNFADILTHYYTGTEIVSVY